jgi:integrase
MPPLQRGQAYRLGANRWGLRYYDVDGVRRRRSAFPSKSAALAHYRDVIEPLLRGELPSPPELTLAEFTELYLERHAVAVRGRTIAILRERLGYAIRAYGEVPLRDLERMSGELASWFATLSEGSRYGIVQSLRQCLQAAVRWDYIGRNPAKLAGPNRQPAPRTVRAFTIAELDAIALELSVIYRPLPAFAAATGLRPEEWAALEPRDVDRKAGHFSVCRTVSEDEHGRRIIVELAKTSTSRRHVPLSRRALCALDELPPRLPHVRYFAAPAGGLLNLDHLRRREWAPAIEASGVARPARIYDLRSTFASRSIAAGVPVFELAKIMGTSVRMIERHYGTLLDGAGAGIAARLDAYDAEQQHRSEQAEGGNHRSS